MACLRKSFSFLKPESIREIRWQGVYGFDGRELNPPLGTNTDQWELKIWSDNDGEPGSQLYSELLDFDEVSNSIAEGSGVGGIMGIDFPRYEFAFTLAAPFEALAGERYWFSILSIAADFEPFFIVIAGYAGETRADGASRRGTDRIINHLLAGVLSEDTSTTTTSTRDRVTSNSPS